MLNRIIIQMENIEKLDSTLFNATIKAEGISFRGVNIGDSIETVVLKEGKLYKDRGGTLPNYKYFIELGEMEELTLVYAYNEETKNIYNLELRLKTYPKYYWEENDGTDEVEFYQKVNSKDLDAYVPHFINYKNKIIAHFENQLGNPQVEKKDFVFKLPHQNFLKHTWTVEDRHLNIMSYENDLNSFNGSVTMELVMILS